MIARKPAELVYAFSVLAFFLYALRDALTGSIRFYFQMFGVSFLWFIPDLMAFVSLAIFAFHQIVVRRNIIGIWFTAFTLFSIGVSVVFMNNTAFALFSSVKMFVPMFVGFCFFDRSITERRWARVALFSIMVISILGLVLNPYVEYPWVGQTLDNFGFEKTAGKLWWAEGEVRYGGFAGDSTMAAFMVVFLYFILSPLYGFAWNVAMWPFLIWGVQVSTSKTALVVLVLYMALYPFTVAFRARAQVVGNLRRLGTLSFACLLVPLALIIIFNGVNLADISPKLMSMSDRIDNSWQLPFKYLNDEFPIGLFIGCGLGCFSYPMDYTDLAAYSVPVDNFYMTTFLMMGLPFLVFVAMQYRSVRFMTDPSKLILILMFNVYSVTVQCYGPSYATLLFGYAFSEMFAWSPFGRRVAARRPGRLDVSALRADLRLSGGTAFPGPSRPA